jgi:hypothetical protein
VPSLREGATGHAGRGRGQPLDTVVASSCPPPAPRAPLTGQTGSRAVRYRTSSGTSLGARERSSCLAADTNRPAKRTQAGWSPRPPAPGRGRDSSPRLAQRGSLFGSAVTAAPGRRSRRDVPAPKRVPARPRPGRMRPNGSAAVRAQYPARCGSTSTRSPWDVVLRRRTIRRRGQLGDDHAVDIQHTDVNALATQIKTGVQHGEGTSLVRAHR